jgi:hypothetical protein
MKAQKQINLSNNLVLKRKAWGSLSRSLRLKRILAWLFLISLEMGAIWLVMHPEFGYFIQGCTLSLVLLYLLFYIGISILPGQGNLTLSTDGFEVSSYLKDYRRKYRWTDVTGFYVGTVATRHQISELVCFDKVGWLTTQRKQTISYYYEGYSVEELTSILNQWKEKYGPNAEGVVLNPVPDSSSIHPKNKN